MSARRKATGVFVIVIAASASLITIGAQATDESVDVFDGLDAATIEDIMFDAEHSGRSPEDVAVDIQAQRLFESEIAPITEEDENFAEARIVDGTVEVYFKNEIPSEVEHIAQVDERIFVSDEAKFTASEADLLNEELASELTELASAEGAFISTVDPVEGTASAVVSEPVEEEPIVIVDAPAAPNARNARSMPAVLSVDISVDVTLHSSTEAVNGGDDLLTRSTGWRQCTAGFPAKNSAGQAGLTSAAHCPNDIVVNGVDNLYNVSLSTSPNTGDAQWQRAKVAVNPHFRYAWSKFRGVISYPSLAVGTSVCRFGGTTGNGTGCTTVKYVSACTKFPDLSYELCQLAMTNGHTGSAGGDSGGPWYYGNFGYGIHSGSNTRDGVLRNWFTPARSAFSYLKLTGMTI